MKEKKNCVKMKKKMSFWHEFKKLLDFDEQFQGGRISLND